MFLQNHSPGEDELYVLGDVVDRGPEPIKTLQDMMRRPNVVFILGNHDFIMYSLMKTLAVEITEENRDSHLTREVMLALNLWLQDGGQITMEKFRRLPHTEMTDILDYIAGASLYEVIGHNGKEYRLVHAGLSQFSPDKKDWMNMKYMIFWKIERTFPEDTIRRTVFIW